MSEPEDRRPVKESLANIAADLRGDVWKQDPKQSEFMYDNSEEVVHLHVKGIAKCWESWSEEDILIRKGSCMDIDDPGCSIICKMCTGEEPKKKRLKRLRKLSQAECEVFQR